MTIGVADERAHEPGADPWWWETWHLDIVTEVGIGLMVRLACAPKLGVAWWWTHLVMPDLPGPIEQFGFVHGDILIGRSRFEITGAGPRSHSWGSPSFDHPTRAMWLRSNQLSMSFAASDPCYADGYVAIEGMPTEPMTTVRGEMRRRADGLPETARDVVDDHFEIDAEVIGLVAIPIVGRDGKAAVLARALCNYGMVDARRPGEARSRDRGIGWSSWLDPANNDA